MKRRYPKDVVFASLHGEYNKGRARFLAKLWTSKGKRATHRRERREAKLPRGGPIYHEGDYYS